MQYSPSRWSKRYTAEEIITAHVKVTTEHSQGARRAVKHRSDIGYAEGPRAKLDVFGEDLPGGIGHTHVVGLYWNL